MHIDGHTQLIAHLGYPTHTFKSPLIYNPWFEARRINAVVVPMGVKTEYYPPFFRSLFELTNLVGALVTMPHKVPTMALVDDLSVTAQVAGACNAVKRNDQGRLVGEQFDGEGFVRGLERKGFVWQGAKAIVNGTGGVGSPIAASLAARGVSALALNDANPVSAERLALRLRTHFPQLHIETGAADPEGFDLVVNATPLGMYDGDPLPFDVRRISPGSMVADVVMKAELTPFLTAAKKQGCRVQVGTDMLFEMIPAYLEFFDLGEATPAELRIHARLAY